MRVSRVDVLRFRIRAQELHRDDGGTDAAVLVLGVQDTGPDGAAWALAVRGASVPVEDLVLAWTLRGAPHFYRRAEIVAVAAATATAANRRLDSTQRRSDWPPSVACRSPGTSTSDQRRSRMSAMP